MIVVRMMEMAVVRVIDVIVVPHGEMPAGSTVNVLVPIVNVLFYVHVNV